MKNQIVNKIVIVFLLEEVTIYICENENRIFGWKFDEL